MFAALRWLRRKPAYRRFDAVRALLQTGGWVLLMLVSHVVAMTLVEDMGLADAVWFTATTVFTVGYGDITPKTDLGRWLTILFGYAGSIFFLAKLFADYADHRADRRERMANGSWRWTMHDHLIIVGTPSVRQPDRFFLRLVRQLRQHPQWTGVPVLLVTRAFAGGHLPTALCDAGVVHRSGDLTDDGTMDALSLRAARAVLVLNDDDESADVVQLDRIDRLRMAGFAGPIVAECVEEENRARIARFGATAVIPSVHAYPAIAARALVAPGSISVVETLVNAEGDEIHRFDLPRPVRSTWARTCARLIEAGVGTPIACLDETGRLLTNPVGEITLGALFVVVRDVPRDVDLAAMLAERVS